MEPSIVLFATAWGPAHGGINSLNADLAIALSEAGADVTCVLPGSTSTAAVNDARSKGVRVLTVGNDSEFEGRDVLAERVIAALDAAHVSADGYLGHDAITGKLAIACKRLRSGLLMIMHHMHYLAYKSLETTGERTAQKDEEQQDVLCAADVVVAVGPLLADSARDLTRGLGDRAPPIATLIPGLADVQPVAAPTQFGIFFAGRLSGPSSHVKQTRLAAAAFGRAVGRCDALAEGDPYLRLLGIREADLESRTLLEDATREAGRPVRILTLPFIEDRNRLLRSLRDHSAAMLLSVHEGFGLTAWEAIACGVPLVVSRNSGVYRFLDETYGGAARGCIWPVSIFGSGPTDEPSPQDIAEVAERVSSIARKPDEARADAKRLLALLHECSWSAAARVVLQLLDHKARTETATEAAAAPAAPAPAGPVRVTPVPAGPKLVRQVLFDIYEPAFAPYYLTRDPDRHIAAMELGDHCWLWGPSGAGKTSLLRRRFASSGAYYYINLAPYYRETVPSLLEHLLAAIHEHLRLTPVVPVGLSVSATIKQIVRAVSATDARGIFHIEEIPLADVDAFREWTTAVCALLLGTIGAQSDVSFALTSLDDPAPCIAPGHQKIRERLRIERVESWQLSELAQLINLCVDSLHLASFSRDYVEPLAMAAAGSPRFVKNCLRKFAVQGIDDLETAIALARQETVA